MSQNSAFDVVSLTIQFTLYIVQWADQHGNRFQPIFSFTSNQVLGHTTNSDWTDVRQMKLLWRAEISLAATAHSKFTPDVR
jgi:hypothetical protein